MNTKEYLAKIELVRSLLTDKIKTVLWDESHNMSKDIRERIRKTGTVSGGRLTGYSLEGYPKNHKGWREKSGYQTSYKDLTITGGLLDSLEPKRKEKSGTTVSVFSSVQLDKKNKHRTYEDIVIGLTKQEALGEEYVTRPTTDERNVAINNTKEKVIEWINEMLK